MTHLLVTNDFPPKVGGIQTYLWELWRRLPSESFAVLTAAQGDARAWDRQQPFPVHRLERGVLLPGRGITDRVNRLASDIGASLVVVDPALPLGRIGPDLELPYAVVVHGAEIVVPARLPVSRTRLAHVLRGAVGVVAAGIYPGCEARRLTDNEIVEVPPGVDPGRFSVPDADGRREARRRIGVPADGPLIVSASRLVPRKGMDVLIEALPHLVPYHPNLTLAIAGAGRDRQRLRTLAGRLGVAKRVYLLGRVSDERLPDVYAAADVFAMLCRNRWWGLEQEGFGIVFLEAAACGVPVVAGASGGAAEAVEDGVTGMVLDPPDDANAAATVLRRLLLDPAARATMGAAGRARAEREFSWDGLAARLHEALTKWEGAHV